MTLRALLAFITLGGLLGCASAAGNSPSPIPIPESDSEPVTVPAIPREEGNRVWRISPSSEVGNYRSVLKTTVEEKNSLESRKSGIITTTDYSLKLTRLSNGLGISGSVSAVEINTDQIRGEDPPSLPAHSLLFDGNISDHKVLLHLISSTQSPSVTPCSDSSETVLSIVSRDLTSVPQEITAGQTWQDSTANLLCSGSVPVVVSMIREYKIIGETSVDGIPALRLERTERSVTSGEGSQGQHQISISGTGTGKAQVYIDRITGLLLGLTATTQVELSIKSSGRIQNFTQRTDEKVVQRSSQ